jgi:DNA-binding transcriptional MocR family regulator
VLFQLSYSPAKPQVTRPDAILAFTGKSSTRPAQRAPAIYTKVNLAHLLRAIEVRPVSPSDGRDAGVLLAEAGTSDAIDATVVLLATPGDRIITSDPTDLTRLAAAARNRAAIVGC